MLLDLTKVATYDNLTPISPDSSPIMILVTMFLILEPPLS